MRTVYTRKLDLELSAIEDTDSYKPSHFPMYPGMEYMESYLEARGGEFDTCTLFGLQYIIHRYIAKRVTAEDVERFAAFAQAHGEPFNHDGWMHIVNRYDGRLPISIRAIPEGMVVPVKNAVAIVRSVVDPKCAWITNWLETQLSRVWYPSTVAIASREIKKVWKHFLDLSSDVPAQFNEIGFKHHDFGSRGVTCQEQAMLGGAAHLLSFLGSDTIAGIRMANHYYDEPMAGFSIPATEHSTITIFGKEHERDALVLWIQKMLVDRTVPAGLPKLAACVGDSYDVFNFTRMVCEPDIYGMIKGSGGTLVVRPDSGDPIEVLLKVFSIFEECLPEGEITINTKGFKVLPACLRLIWGDGINRRSMKTILKAITDAKWSASNLAFGSGGGLLMDFNRDTQKWAFKLSYAIVDGVPRKVSKDPITDPGKRSKEGHLDLIVTDKGVETIVLPDNVDHHPNSVMVTYYEGDITFHTTFAACRSRMSI